MPPVYMWLVLLILEKRGVGLDSEDPPVHCLLAAYAIYSVSVLGSCLPCPFLTRLGLLSPM